MQAGAHQAVQILSSQPSAASTSLTSFRLKSPAPGQTPAAGSQHPESIRDSPEGLVLLQLPIPARQPVPFGCAEIPVLQSCQAPGNTIPAERPTPHQPTLQHQRIGAFLALTAAITLTGCQGFVETGQSQAGTTTPGLDPFQQQIHIVASRWDPGHAEGIARQTVQPLGQGQVGVINGGHGQAQSVLRRQAGQLPHQGGLAGAHRSVQEQHRPALVGAALQVRQVGQQRLDHLILQSGRRSGG